MEDRQPQITMSPRRHVHALPAPQLAAPMAGGPSMAGGSRDAAMVPAAPAAAVPAAAVPAATAGTGADAPGTGVGLVENFLAMLDGRKADKMKSKKDAKAAAVAADELAIAIVPPKTKHHSKTAGAVAAKASKAPAATPSPMKKPAAAEAPVAAASAAAPIAAAKRVLSDESVKAIEKAAALGVKLGCSKCRYSTIGCGNCRNPEFAGKRFNAGR